VESASEAGCWLKTVRSQESLCSLGGPAIGEGHCRKMKTAGKATGNHPGKYMRL